MLFVAKQNASMVISAILRQPNQLHCGRRGRRNSRRHIDDAAGLAAARRLHGAGKAEQSGEQPPPGTPCRLGTVYRSCSSHVVALVALPFFKLFFKLEVPTFSCINSAIYIS
jgi:hypothetical protein